MMIEEKSIKEKKEIVTSVLAKLLKQSFFHNIICTDWWLPMIY